MSGGCWLVCDPMACQGNGVVGVHSVHDDELSARRAAMGEFNETSLIVRWAQWGADLYTEYQR